MRLFCRICPGSISSEYEEMLANELIPGRILADASVFISCAMVLSVFTISKYHENGVAVEPSVEQTTGTIRWVVPSIKKASASNLILWHSATQQNLNVQSSLDPRKRLHLFKRIYGSSFSPWSLFAVQITSYIRIYINSTMYSTQLSSNFKVVLSAACDYFKHPSTGII